MKKKVFIGLSDVASQISDLKIGLENSGYQTITASTQRNTITKNKFDHDLSNIRRFYFRGIRPRCLQNYLRTNLTPKERLFKKAIKNCNTFIFVWKTFYPDLSDLKLLKELGKKIIVFFMGSDIRAKDACSQEYKIYKVPSFFSKLDDYFYAFPLEYQLKFLRNVEKYADVIYSLPNQSQLALRPYQHFYIPVNLKEIIENPIQRKSPVIAHAPSKKFTKGTNIVLNTLQKLKEEGLNFQINLIDNLSNKIALQEYTNSDILIDQLYIPSGGKLAREALAAGAIVLSSISKHYIDNIPFDCPIIDVNPNTLYKKLKQIIMNYDLRVKLAKKGRKYVEKYHDINKLTKKMMLFLETPEQERKYDYEPKFFREEFIPPDRDIELYNKWTNHVKNTWWYDKYVEQGVRNKLLF